MVRARQRWPVGVIAVVVLSACGGSSGESAAPSSSTRRSTTSASTTTTSTTVVSKDGYVKVKVDPSLPRQDIDVNVRYPVTFTEAQREVVHAWANYRHVFYATVDPPDPDSPFLRSTTTAATWVTARQQRREMLAAGLVARLPRDGLHRDVVTHASVHKDVATLVVCEVDTAVQTRVATGEVVDDSVSTRKLRVPMRRVNTTWRLDAGGSQVRVWPGIEEDRCVDSLD